jgi:histidinol phosphatase-like PHP family hydrolase
MAYPQKMVAAHHYSRLAHKYFGGLTHAHTVLSNHTGHHESNLSVDRIVETLREANMAGDSDAPFQYIMLNEHPSDPVSPRLLGRLSLRGRRLLKQRRRPIVGRVPILYGLEVSLLPTGRTDLTPRLADRCPLVIASRHGLPSTMVRDAEAITDLFLSACDNPAVDVIGHPPRYIEDMDEIRWKKIFRHAAETGTAIEINLNTFPSADAHPIQIAFWTEWLADLAASKTDVFIGTDIHNQLQLDGFISQWRQLDEHEGQHDNHLAVFLKALKTAKIDPKRVVTADYDIFLDWLALDKLQRASLH